MKFVITVIIVVGLSLGAWQIYQYWETFAPAPPSANAPAPPPTPDGDYLPGLPPKLGPVLDSARQRGAAGLRDFLAANGKSITDPRLASIQLDYVLLVSQSDPGEARKIFAQVKARLKPDSPVYNRMQQLQKTYD